MNYNRVWSYAVLAVSLCLIELVPGCRTKIPKQEPMSKIDTVAGTFGYDVNFLNKHKETILLKDASEDARVLIVPGWQARVMTSTASGNEGFSYGWINYKLIASEKQSPHMNAFGGEERLWLGPEGGPFSIYFAKGREQIFDNWYVPAELDTVAFETISKTDSSATFSKKFSLVNYAGNKFDIGILRIVTLFGKERIAGLLGLTLPDSVKCVAYQSENVLVNNGINAWTKESGLLSIWMLSMLTPSPEVTVFIPYKAGNSAEGKTVVRDDYFGKVPSERLTISKGIIYFKADGKYRSKIGVPPEFAGEFSASYDALHHALTLLWCRQPDAGNPYVNSKWGPQKDPYSGDALNAYNDGPLEDGTQMGPFYELESSSPAASLKPGQKLLHIQRIYHFEGPEPQLRKIMEKLFGVGPD